MTVTRFAGIDIGSRTVEIVVLENNLIVEHLQEFAGHDPLRTSLDMLSCVRHDHLVATGYGRELLELYNDTPTVTEIKAYAVGARSVVPGCRTILDIGGQDIKAISLFEDGRVRKFEMNDRCAAGSGKFLEMMANALGFSLEEFAKQALSASEPAAISSMCAVFAESEVTSLLHRGSDRSSVALGLHHSVVNRTLSMLMRAAVVEPLVFAGGAARNICLHDLLEKRLGIPAIVPELPQHIGALGAARIAKEMRTPV
jgi:(R)-2-hydroxyacyl-CoA dehydratese activating ATPase